MNLTNNSFHHFHERSATVLLALLITSDLTFIALHVVYKLILDLLVTADLSFMTLDVVNKLRNKNPLIDISVTHGFPEFFQYIKFYWICLLLIYLCEKFSSKLYSAWIPLFMYFLLDDSLSIHEHVGGFLASHLPVKQLFGLRPQDYGELAVSLFAGGILLIPLALAYKNGSLVFRKISQDLAFLVGILLFFGIGVDMVHHVMVSDDVKTHTAIKYFDGLITIVEDGGEMLSVSFILWYIFLITVRPNENNHFLCDVGKYKKRGYSING